MLKKYLRITFRNLITHKSYALINIFGLALGMACCLLILAYIGYEFSFDGYHKNKDRVYRVISEATTLGKTREVAIAPVPLAETLVNDFPEVVDAVRFMPTVKRAFNYEGTKFFQTGVFYAGQSVFKIFSFELVEGNPATALEAPFTMVVTEETARKYFGDENPIGKVVQWDNNFEYTVTGVMKAPPPNSHFTFEVLASFATLIKYDPRLGSSWSASYATYLLLQENTALAVFKKKLEDFNDQYLRPIFKERGDEEGRIALQPLPDIHLGSSFEYELGVNSDMNVIYTFSGIAVVIVVVACINFMNLATARSASRSKEIGVRKALGAKRSELVTQFLGESFIFAVLALILAVGIAWLALPYFRDLASRAVSFDFLQTPLLLAGLTGVVLFVGFVAGSYPAFFLSSFHPVVVLSGNTQKGARNSVVRSILVVFQFAISAILIISTLVVIRQHNYLKNKELGFNKQNVLVIALQNKEVRLGLESFKNEIRQIRGVLSAGSSSMVPGEMFLFTAEATPQGFPAGQKFRMENFYMDFDYLPALEVEIIKGRGFSKKITTDETDAVMINETAMKKLEWADPLGKTIEIPDAFEEETVRKTVVGVFRDIHQRALYDAISPTFVQHISDEGPVRKRARRLAVRLAPDQLPEAMQKIESKWKEIFPNHPYYSFFLDEFYDGQHKAEERLGKIFQAFSAVAVLLGCVGFLGLTSYIAEKRTKEIGVRKVLGSSVIAIVFLLCKKFLILVIIANLIAWPVAFFAMQKWLQNFPYPVQINPGVFAFTAVLTLVIALSTVGYRSIKAARANPVKSLRYE
mgnify:CR=1 FL=1